jgi:arginase
LAVKIVRQAKNIALLGAPTSAASLAPGHELAPGALRAAGLVERLTQTGFTVTDYGDCATKISQPDEEHPRARGAGQVLATLEELRPKVEIAVKSGALPVVLGGDDSIVLATIAGVRRYYRDVSLIYLDRDAGLNVPASTPSGCVDGMVISHVLGRGAPELVRFWGEPPLVREPDVVLFGIDRVDEPEQQFLQQSPVRRYLASDVTRLGAAEAAKQALDHAHGHRNDFVLHIDLDVISSDDFGATNLPASGGLGLEAIREALSFWVRQPRLAAIEISGYNPALDPAGAAAKRLIALLADVLAPRLEPPAQAPAPAPVVDAAAPEATAAAVPASVAPSDAAQPAEAVVEPTGVAASDSATEPAVENPVEPKTSDS